MWCLGCTIQYARYKSVRGIIIGLSSNLPHNCPAVSKCISSVLLSSLQLLEGSLKECILKAIEMLLCSLIASTILQAQPACWLTCPSGICTQHTYLKVLQGRNLDCSGSTKHSHHPDIECERPALPNCAYPGKCSAEL